MGRSGGQDLAVGGRAFLYYVLLHPWLFALIIIVTSANSSLVECLLLFQKLDCSKTPSLLVMMKSRTN